MNDPVAIVARAIPAEGNVDPRCVAIAVIDGLRSAGLLMEWRPIEEAPKDGTLVDIWATHHVWSWKYPPSLREGRIPTCKWDEENGHWMGPNKEDDEDTAQHYVATHFMPLPAPASEGGD